MVGWFRKSGGDPLVVAMAGVRLGERVLVVGSGDGTLLAGVAVKSGLTGRTCIVDESAGAATAAAAAAEAAGALVEAFSGPWTALPFERESVDVAILRDVLPALPPGVRTGCLHEIFRVLRPGGRCVVIDTVARTGLAGLIGRRPPGPFYEDGGGAFQALQQHGFRAVRTLAEREGLVFVEGARPATA